MKSANLCRIPGCSKLRKLNSSGISSRRWCAMHLSRLYQNGSLFANVKPKQVDGVGYIRPDGYKVISIDYKNCFEHRLVWENVNGLIPKGHQVHHINGNRLDNRIKNLRCMPKSEHIKLHRYQEQHAAQST